LPNWKQNLFTREYISEAELTFDAFGLHFDLYITYPDGALANATGLTGTVGGDQITGLSSYFGHVSIGVISSYPYVNSDGITFRVGATNYIIEADYNPALGLVPDVFTSASTDYAMATNIALTYLACFASGTRIATATGQVPVERLRVGDLVRTLSGQDWPVCWIGHRHVETRRHPKPNQVWPVRISADAFAPAMPLRDLWLSPDHAVFVDGV
jgi:collagen type I alpha